MSKNKKRKSKGSGKTFHGKHTPRSAPKADAPVKKEHIFVAIPSTNNSMTLALHGFIAAVERLSALPQFPYVFSHFVVNGKKPIPYVRNYLIAQFLKTNASKLWFIDQDMMPTERSLLLLEADADICAGRMFKYDHANPDKGTSDGLSLCGFMYNVNNDGLFNPIVPAEGDPPILDVDAVGTASMLIRRHVLEDKRMWLDTKYEGINFEPCDLADEKDTDPDWGAPIFQEKYRPDGKRVIGSDLEFCYRAKKLGYSIKFHMGAPFGHYKSVDLDSVLNLLDNTVKRALDGDECPSNTAYESGLGGGNGKQTSGMDSPTDGQITGADRGRVPVSRESDREVGDVGVAAPV